MLGQVTSGLLIGFIDEPPPRVGGQVVAHGLGYLNRRHSHSQMSRPSPLPRELVSHNDRAQLWLDAAPALQCHLGSNKYQRRHDGPSPRKHRLVEQPIEETLVLRVLFELPFAGLHDLSDKE